MMKSNLIFKVETALFYPFVLILYAVPVWIFALILMLGSLSAYGKDDEYYNMKQELAPKRFLSLTWQITADLLIEGGQEMKDSWPIMLVILVVGLLPLAFLLVDALLQVAFL